MKSTPSGGLHRIVERSRMKNGNAGSLLARNLDRLHAFVREGGEGAATTLMVDCTYCIPSPVYMLRIIFTILHVSEKANTQPDFWGRRTPGVVAVGTYSNILS